LVNPTLINRGDPIMVNFLEDMKSSVSRKYIENIQDMKRLQFEIHYIYKEMFSQQTSLSW
jgi:hypothetical protein